MQIVTDRAADLSPEQLEGMPIHFAPLRLTLDGVTYSSGIDIQPAEFYDLLSKTESSPTTSQPSAGEFAELYRNLAKTDPEILSVHISSGLSGTLNAAKAGAQMVPEADVKFFDTKLLSCPEGWLVEAAARAAAAGWNREKILEMLAGIRGTTQGLFTVATLKYLIHGGRISHIKGLLASLLNIKPIIGVDPDTGMYVQLGREVTLKRAIGHEADIVERWFGAGSKLRVQLLHANHPEGVEILKNKMSQLFTCTFLPSVNIGPVLGAHTGPGLVGMAVAPLATYESLP